MEKNLQAYTGEELLGLARSFANSFRGMHPEDMDEAASCFVLGALEAVKRYDPEKTADGSIRAYQVACGRGEVMHYIRSRGRVAAAESVSLAKEMNDGEEVKVTLADMIAAKSEKHLDETEREAVALAVASLPERESAVMTSLFWLGRNMTETGAALGMSTCRVSQIAAKATETLRGRLKGLAAYAAA